MHFMLQDWFEKLNSSKFINCCKSKQSATIALCEEANCKLLLKLKSTIGEWSILKTEFGRNIASRPVFTPGKYHGESKW